MFAPWRKSPLVRIVGSAGSWFLFSLSFSLLFQVTITVMALGGTCASGGPYEIAVECPDNVAAFAPLSIFGGLLSVGVSLFLAQGFGTPLSAWAWPVLFVGLGGAFLLAFVSSLDWVGLFIGVPFVLMGLAPIVLELRGSVQRVLLGQFAADGRQFYEGEGARKSLLSPNEPNPAGSVVPTAGHWMLALVLSVGGIVASLAVATAAQPASRRIAAMDSETSAELPDEIALAHLVIGIAMLAL
ncbi:MAG: hypothetical protein ABL886_06950, partial [Rhodoglobus sp.]